jgi:predicted DNA-binding transcriptional regulator YafY
VAWDVDRSDFRTFRVDRIAPSAVTRGQRFVPRQVPGGDLGAYVSRSVATNPYTFKANVILHAPLEVIAPFVTPLTGRLERLDAQRCRLLTGGNSLRGLAMHIAMLAVEFDVVEPRELAGVLAELAGRFSRAAKRQGRGREQGRSRNSGAEKSSRTTGRAKVRS